MPDEDAPLAPSTDWGRLLLEVESLAVGIARRNDVPVAALRYATIAGSHVPSPLGRVLRLPTVPVPALADPPFSLLDRDDAARAMVEALLRSYDGPLNIVGPGATSPWQAVRFGGRLPLPVDGFGWRWARRMTEFLGAPMPDHVMDVLRKGLTGDGSRAFEELGLGFVRADPGGPRRPVCVGNRHTDHRGNAGGSRDPGLHRRRPELRDRRRPRPRDRQPHLVGSPTARRSLRRRRVRR